MALDHSKPHVQQDLPVGIALEEIHNLLLILKSQSAKAVSILRAVSLKIAANSRLKWIELLDQVSASLTYACICRKLN